MLKWLNTLVLTQELGCHGTRATFQQILGFLSVAVILIYIISCAFIVYVYNALKDCTSLDINNVHTEARASSEE